MKFFFLLSIFFPAFVFGKEPHIVLILCDDLGYSDLGCYGGEIQTPNIDALAEMGVRYTQFMNTSRCCPSRAALLSGNYPHDVNMGWMTAVDEHRDGYRGELSPAYPTLAEILRGANYATAMSGKWHLTLDRQIVEPSNGSWPTERGFEKFFGCLAGGGSYRRHGGYVDGAEFIPKESLPSSFYYTDAITNHAVKFIEDHDPSQPLFLYLAHYAPHRPLDAPKNRTEIYFDRYEPGYDVLRQERFQRLKTLGLIEQDATLGAMGLSISESLPTGEPLPAWEDLSKTEQGVWIKEMSTYAAMIEIMDDGIGAVVNALENRGMREHTLFIFLSDNGSTFEGGRISTLAANLSNTPYRGYKQLTDLGGVASPLILSGYGIPSVGGLNRERTHIIDLLPTCLNAAGVAYPVTFRQKAINPPSGISLLGRSGDKSFENRILYWEHQTSRAVSKGVWRLVSYREDFPWRLYNLFDDPFCYNDISSTHPEVVDELASEWLNWANDGNVLPLEPLRWKERIEKYEEIGAN